MKPKLNSKNIYFLKYLKKKLKEEETINKTAPLLIDSKYVAMALNLTQI